MLIDSMKKLKIILTVTILISGCKNESASINKELVEGRDIITAHGMVVTSHPQSSRNGAVILQKGGNAVDAAVAVEFSLAVCYPEAGNIGGGGFMLIRNNDGSKSVIDYREKAPLDAARDMYLNNSGEIIEGL